MDLHKFDLNLLVALDALLAERNVTHAGMRMNLSQSAMSGALARLRRSFHDELLVPVGRHMVLTPLAQDLVQPVRDVLLQVRGTLGTKARFDAATSDRHFSLAASDYVTTILMVDALREAKLQAPAITFDLRPVGQRAIEDLERGNLDFAIAPRGYVSAAHPSEVLFEETFTCVVCARNGQVGPTLSIDQYLSLGHVVVQVGEGGAPNYDERVLRQRRCRRRVEVLTSSFDLAPQLVIGTDRIATLATRLARKYAEFLPIRLVPVPVQIPPMIEMLQWHRAHDRDPAHQWFRAQLKNAVARLPALSDASITKGHGRRPHRPWPLSRKSARPARSSPESAI